MQTDLSNGVRYLVKEGIADPARVCIVGASYGGYAALAGAALDPGAYRCAVAVAGVADIKRWDGRSRLLNGIDVPKWICTASTSTEKGATTMNITAVGFDLAKSVFQVHGVDQEGRASRSEERRVGKGGRSRW